MRWYAAPGRAGRGPPKPAPGDATTATRKFSIASFSLGAVYELPETSGCVVVMRIGAPLGARIARSHRDDGTKSRGGPVVSTRITGALLGAYDGRAPGDVRLRSASAPNNPHGE